MLNIWIGENEDCLWTPKAYFDNFLPNELIDTDITRDIVKRIDASDFVSVNLVVSPVLGAIAPSFISTTSKSLIILAQTDFIVPLEFMGENAYPILGELSKNKDVNIQMETFKMMFQYTGVDKIRIINDNSIVNTDMELVYKFQEFA